MIVLQQGCLVNFFNYDRDATISIGGWENVLGYMNSRLKLRNTQMYS